MSIKSPVFRDEESIPTKYTCLGENCNPPLVFSDVPSQAKSLILLVEDVTAGPTPWIHWFVFNISPFSQVDEGKIPVGAVEGKANGGKPGYEGPCPKYFTGEHRYVFSLFALDVLLDFKENSDKDDVFNLARDHIVDKAILTGLCRG